VEKMDFQQLFALGMKRRLPELLTFDVSASTSARQAGTSRLALYL
jgi:hypothetical protein